MMMAIAAALMMSTTILAQENSTEKRPEGKRPDQTEMVKQRTDETVKKYGLNEEQAAKLLDLNTRYAEKMGPRFGMRPDGPRGGRGMRPDSARQQRVRPDGEQKEARPEMKEGRPERREAPGMRGNREQMRKDMEAYENELKEIMTPEQYEAYKADREKRMKEGPRGPRR